VAEPDADLLAEARRNPRWDGVTWVSVEELLGDRRIQMVCVETDPLDSLPYALRSIEAGKHTKIDKPPGIDLKALQNVFTEAERRHVLVQMGYVYRYNPAFRLAFQAIREGWLGPVRSLVCQMNDTQTPVSRKRLDRYPGGLLYEICCHMIDPLIWLMGEPKRVSSVLRHTEQADDELEDDVQAMFEFDPAVAVVKSHTRDGERYFYIFGQEGSLQIDSPDRPRVRLALSNPHGQFSTGVQEVPVGPAVRYLHDLDDLAQAIRERKRIEHFTPEHDLLVHRMLLRACGLDV
jgi:predicted dehydrogenase